MGRMRRSASLGAAFLAVMLAAAACGTARQPPQPAGKSPAQISRMICLNKTARELAQVVGATAARTPPTWTESDHVYSCDYRYDKGTMVLSVKELSSWGQTYSYFHMLARTLHKTMTIYGLGQAAFRVRDGSVVVRKDWKILFADTSGMHGIVGSPGDSPSQLALDAAAVILACWAGD
jgi:hypothetical protein